MTGDLVAWLRGVLDEDEASSRYLLQLWESSPTPDETAIEHHHWRLDDIEAKRAILDAGGDGDEWGERIQFPTWDTATCSDNCGPDVWWSVVKTLAAAYRARPGYRDEWAPQ